MRTTTANHSRRKTFFLIFSLFLHFFVLILAASLSFLISFNFFNPLLLIHRLLARFLTVLHDYFIVHLLTNLTVRQEVRQSHVLDVVAWGPCTRIPAKSLRDEGCRTDPAKSCLAGNELR